MTVSWNFPRFSETFWDFSRLSDPKKFMNSKKYFMEKMMYFMDKMKYLIFSIKYFIEFMNFLRSESLEKSQKVPENLGKFQLTVMHLKSLLSLVYFKIDPTKCN